MKNSSDKIKYFIYARKSTESEDRQVLSISSQIDDSKKVADKFNLKVAKVFSESKSAKQPGREVFNEIIERIKSGEVQGIICWKLDRLARNPVDGGQISWLLQNGIIKYDMKNIDLKEIVLKTINDKKLAIEAKGLKVETEINDGGYNIMGDSFWLSELVNNLIENSIKYTREGKIMVGLDKKDGKVIFSVKDTGVGITEEDKKNLFTEGGRGKDSVKVNVDSTGYGLYTVKLIVDAHKGKVWMEPNKDGVGSTFWVELDAV